MMLCQIEKLPEELKQIPQWVAWRGEPKRNGKLDKIPINPKTGSNASTTDPATWSSFEQAVERAEKDHLAGIGFVFSDHDAFVGIDLDDCIDETSQIRPKALEVLRALNSYSEISPSQKGIKVFARGKLPGAGKQGNGIEFYDSGRFFTVTGLALDGLPATIEPRQEAVSALYTKFFGNGAGHDQPPSQSGGPILADQLLEKCHLLTFCKEKADSGVSLSHSLRIAIGSYAVALGDLNSVDTPFLTHMLKGCPDFKPAYSRKQLESIKCGFPWGCAKIREQVVLNFDDFDPTRCNCELQSSRKPTPMLHVFPELVVGKGKKAGGADKEKWDLALELFPRKPFPWDVFPAGIADSLVCLAKSCATTANPLPGVVFPLMGSILGRTLVVSPWQSWVEPLIFWIGDIRKSGAGKTPPATLLTEALAVRQREEHRRYDGEMELWKRLSKKERDSTPQPSKPRGYLVTDLTLEGLRSDLENHPTGGLAILLDELSGFVTAQNQYKSGKGSDRESWLKLWSGDRARVVRAGKTIFLDGARVSISGGIQPGIFRSIFLSNNGLYMEDGTLFRFVLTFEPPQQQQLTGESWEGPHKEAWDSLIMRSMEWVDGQVEQAGGIVTAPNLMAMKRTAVKNFMDWRNGINDFHLYLPDTLQGFLPKLYSYGLRFAGVLHCIKQFSIGKSPSNTLTVDDVQAGARVAEFYAGQIVDVVKLFEDADYLPADPLPQHGYLAAALDSLRSEVDNGRLAVGHIWERFDRVTPPLYRVRNSRALGAMIRSIPLTIPQERHRANGRAGVYCLVWDAKVENFIIENVPDVHQCPQSYMGQGSTVMDIETQKMPMSIKPDFEGVDVDGHRGRASNGKLKIDGHLGFSGGARPSPQTRMDTNRVDIDGHRGHPLKDENEIIDVDSGELPEVRRVVDEDGQVREVCEI